MLYFKDITQAGKSHRLYKVDFFPLVLWTKLYNKYLLLLLEKLNSAKTTLPK